MFKPTDFKIYYSEKLIILFMKIYISVLFKLHLRNN